MTLREHISIARRSWRLLYSMSRRFFAAILAYSVVTALLPYIPVWFSARLIDALAAGAEVQVLIRYAALTVGLTALGTLLSAVLNAQKEIGFQEANCSYEWMHAEKAMALAYASIEDREVSLLRERIQTETRMGWNVFYLDSCIEQFVRFGVQIFASIALTASFFTLHAIAPAAKLAFVGGILVSLTVAVLTSARSSAINMEFFKDSVTVNITLDKYSTYIRNYSSGKDIRLYAMTAPLVKYAGNFYKTICDREARAYFRRALLRLATVLMDHVLRFGVYLLLISGALRGGVSVGSTRSTLRASCCCLRRPTALCVRGRSPWPTTSTSSAFSPILTSRIPCIRAPCLWKSATTTTTASSSATFPSAIRIRRPTRCAM